MYINHIFGALLIGAASVSCVTQSTNELNSIIGNSDSTLTQAIESNNLEAVKTAIKNGKDIHIRLEDGSSLLHLASKQGSQDISAFLLSQGVDVNARTNQGLTPLMVAVQNNQTKLVELLLAKNSDVNAKTENNDTAIIFAADKGDLAIVQKLIASGADPTLKNSSGYNALSYARNKYARQILHDYNLSLAVILSVEANKLTELEFQNLARLALRRRGWEVNNILPSQVEGLLTKADRTFKCRISYDGSEIMLRYMKGYGSNRLSYLSKILNTIEESLTAN